MPSQTFISSGVDNSVSIIPPSPSSPLPPINFVDDIFNDNPVNEFFDSKITEEVPDFFDNFEISNQQNPNSLCGKPFKFKPTLTNMNYPVKKMSVYDKVNLKKKEDVHEEDEEEEDTNYEVNIQHTNDIEENDDLMFNWNAIDDHGFEDL